MESTDRSRSDLSKFLRFQAYVGAIGLIAWLVFRWVGGELVTRLDAVVPFGYQCLVFATGLFCVAVAGAAAGGQKNEKPSDAG